MLLACINCTKGFHCDIFIWAYNVLCQDHSLHYAFLSSFSHFLSNFNGFHYSFLYVYMKYCDNIHVLSPSPFILPASTHKSRKRSRNVVLPLLKDSLLLRNSSRWKCHQKRLWNPWLPLSYVIYTDTDHS
jgi:hypothetical protein